MDVDQQIGRNLARLRGDMTQQELARRMKELGWKWSQSTVWSIERGDRPLRLGEAADLQRILHPMATSMLLWGDGRTTVQEQMGQVSEAWKRLVESAEKLWEAQLELAVAADDERTELSAVQQAGVRDWLAHGIDRLRAELELRDRVQEATSAVEAGESVEEARKTAAENQLDGFYARILRETWDEAPDGKHSEAS